MLVQLGPNGDMVMIMFIGILVFAVGYWLIRKHKRLVVECTESVEGVVAQINSESSSDGKSTLYSPTFAYMVNGKEYRYSSGSSSTRCGFRQGQKVTVCHVPGNPTRCYVREEKMSIIMYHIVAIIGVVVFVFGVIGLLK